MLLVPRRSVLGPNQANIFICSIFFTKAECDAGSYADDNTPHSFNFCLEHKNLRKTLY